MFVIFRNSLPLCLFSLGYLLVRCSNLHGIPLFNDEAIYLDWGFRELHKGVPYYSLLDGKQPLVLWLFGLAEGFISDPLVAGRIVAIISGLMTSFGLFFIGQRLWHRNIGILSAVLYTLSPYFSFFDRQALLESPLGAIEVWICYFSVRLLDTQKLWVSICLGFFIGLGILTKSSIFLFLLCLLFVFMFFFLRGEIKKKSLFLMIVSFFIAQIIALPLYLQAQFWQTLHLNDRYILTVHELMLLPFEHWLTSFGALLQIAFWQLNPFFFVCFVISVFIIFKKGTNSQKIVLCILLLTLFCMILIAKTSNPRYFVSVLSLSCLFVASLWELKSRARAVFYGLLMVWSSYFLILQITQPLIYFSQLDFLTAYSQRDSYLVDDTAGYASLQAIEYIQATSPKTAVVAVRLDTGNPENMIFTYFHNSTTRIPTYLEARIINNGVAYSCLTYVVPVYFVSRDFQLAGLERFLVEEKRFYNIDHHTSVGVYHFKTPCRGSVLNLASPGAILQP